MARPSGRVVPQTHRSGNAMRVPGNGLGRSAVARVPACHNYSNGASGTVKRLRNRRLPACTEIYKCLTFSVPTMRRVRARQRRSRSRPWAAPWRRRPQETDCRRADRMPRLLASLPVTELACAALVALTDLVRAWAPPSGMLPPSSPWPCSLPWLLNVPRRHGVISGRISSPRTCHCRAPTRPVCLAACCAP